MILSAGNTQYMVNETGFRGERNANQIQAEKHPEKKASDRVSLSRNARHLSAITGGNGPSSTNEHGLSPEEEKEVENLKQTDQEVKAHERAHMAAGADLIVGGANYQYQTGPDGKMYAVSGEVKIDTSKERDPEDTIRKMQRVRKAALAPSQPSATDKKVAAEASQTEAQARAEVLKEKKEKEETRSHEGEMSQGVEQLEDYNAGALINITA